MQTLKRTFEIIIKYKLEMYMLEISTNNIIKNIYKI